MAGKGKVDRVKIGYAGRVAVAQDGRDLVGYLELAGGTERIEVARVRILWVGADKGRMERFRAFVNEAVLDIVRDATDGPVYFRPSGRGS